MSARIDRVVTSGTFSLDGGTWAVDNNVWLIGNYREVLVVDAAHDPDAIVAGVGGRRVVAVLCTHGHNDHINVAPELAERLYAPVLLHPADEPLWRMTHPDARYRSLADTARISVAGIDIEILHTPGHSPGSVCLYLPELNALCTGDTLFAGGPGATGRSYSDFGTIIDSIRDRLLTLPDETTVHTGHGEDTTIGAEKPSLADWIARGH
ncbi:MBL fold metallo-hydrolase [Nocardia bhagyanarayanae]|uniref:Glyoxylase-like metal-dependent hydrolase (Beta-lactamase superfamily II) n=1 Tax=Nocardia bhagyanarayanae TaxID=1215925 RepID=A0A543FC37_9NOCA|nr:MBL fold metallo-hydrolase [Nocardia bhagyanarayanae]TQM31392.1 glyoxylase-like metal-dependent hydrolase (beta-lactamase superfamily II) [Nocardia bhagyanarayanae]